MAHAAPRTRRPASSAAASSPAAAFAAAALLGTACGDGAPTGPVATGDDCGPFGDWSQSSFVLPYPVGASYTVGQANCSGFGHSDFWTYGYDFLMPIGSLVTASRAGTVGWANDGCPDFSTACTNLITVIHDDGLVSLYSHLTRGGVLVSSGRRVQAGDTIGLSGVTGNTGGVPHLHFSVHPCNELPGLPGARHCPTLPVSFRNTTPNPRGLRVAEEYTAEPF